MNSSQSPPVVALSDQPNLVLTGIRDIIACAEIMPGTTIYADLRGIVTSVAKTKRTVFIIIHDSTGSLQLKVNKDRLTDVEFEACKRISKYMRVHAQGLYEPIVNREGITVPTVSVSQAPDVSDSELDNLEASTLDDEIAEIGNQLFLARFRERANEFLQRAGFLALETRSISSRWQGDGVRPLRLDYPGFGSPAYLVPSPRTQLLRAMVFTGKNKIFSVARCFTATHRDSLVSAESLFVAIEWLDSTMEQMVAITVEALRYILTDAGTLPNDKHFLEMPWKTASHSWPPQIIEKSVPEPTVQIFEVKNEASMPGLQTIFRVCWPPDIVLAEGACEVLRDNAFVSTASIHLERLISTIVPARRRIQDLRQLPWRRQ